MKKITLFKASSLVMLFLFLSASSVWGQDYFIDFETSTSGNKTGYATGTVDLSGFDWEMTQALIGTLANDKKFGDRSARIRRSGDTFGEMVMLEDKPNGIGTISFYYARYGTETGQPNLTIQYSTNEGADWIEIGTITSFPNDLTQYSADVNVDENIRIRFITDLSGTNERRINIDNILVTDFVPADQVATPSFNPGTGSFYAPFDLEITTATEDATIRYSFDSNDPEAGTWVVYDDGDRPNITETTTIWAYAEKTDMDDSNVASAVFTFPIEVASIEALQDIAEIDGLYRITGEVFMTNQNDSRNQKYFQDELTGGRGIKIDDNNGFLTTELNIGDGITNLTGTITNFNRMIQFIPIENQSPESAHSTGNTLTPLPVTLAEIIDEDNIITVAGQEISVFQALLIEIEDLQFEQTGNFDSGASFGELPISDPTASLADINDADFGVIFRVEYDNLDYDGDPIPQVPLTLTAIVDQRLSNARIFARDWDDFDIPDPLLFVSPASITDLDYVIDMGPSDSQSFQLTGVNLDGSDVTVTAPGDFEVSQNENTGFESSITLVGYDGSPETIWVRLEAGLPIGDYLGNAVISGGDADDVQVALIGDVTEPPITEVPFETKFGTADNWWADGTMTSYNEKTYTEGGWIFYGEDAVRGTSYPFDDSDYAFRERVFFSITNLAPAEGMTGFSLQLLDWMLGVGGNRDLDISFDGGDSWETLLTVNKDWFNDYQVYQEFVHYFDETKDFGAEEFIISIGGGATNNNNRINIGQFKALDEEPDPELSVNPQALVNLDYLENEGPSASQSFEITGRFLQGENVVITPPVNFEIAEVDEENEFSTDAITLTNYDGNETDIFVRLASDLQVGTFDGTITLNIQGPRSDHDATVEVSGQVVESFNIPYANAFRSIDDYDRALLQGLAIDDAIQETGAGGYLRIFPDGYIETPVIDFTEFDFIVMGFDATTYGGAEGQELSVMISNDEGVSYNLLGEYQITGDYESYTYLIDLTDTYDSEGGRIKIEMSDGGQSTRFRDFFIQDDAAMAYNETLDTYYQTLQDAVDAANPGDRIRFIGSFTSLDASDSGVILAPGSTPGCATFTGNYLLDNTITQEFIINGNTPCADYSQIDVGGTATLDNASLDINLGFAPAMNGVFTIIQSNDLNGEFEQGSEITATFGGEIFTFEISYDDDDVTLTVTGIDDVIAIPVGKWTLLLLIGLIAGYYLITVRSRAARKA